MIETNKALEQAAKYKTELAGEGIVCKTFATMYVGTSKNAVAEV